jgi:hypothetical protein
LSRGRRTDRIAYTLKDWDLPEPIPGAEWQRVSTFNAAQEILADPSLKEVFKTVLENGAAVVDRPENNSCWSKMMEAASNNLLEMLDSDVETAPGTFDNYRSVGDPDVMMFVSSGAVPPFRFKAGGWDLLQSSIDLGPVMKTRIAEKSFFMCRVIEGGQGWTELKDLVAPPEASVA